MDHGPKCQSCGMPLGVGFFGTNADSTANTEYCKYCYEAGQFKEPNITIEEMTGRCAARLIDHEDMDRDSAEKLANILIPGLLRWKIPV